MAYPESNTYPDTEFIMPPTPDTSCSSSLKKPEWLGINPPTPDTSCSSSAKNPEIA